MNSAKSDSCLSIRASATQKPIIELQNSIIESYRERLTECQSHICKIRKTNEFDVDDLVESLLHTPDDVTQYSYFFNYREFPKIKSLSCF